MKRRSSFLGIWILLFSMISLTASALPSPTEQCPSAPAWSVTIGTSQGGLTSSVLSESMTISSTGVVTGASGISNCYVAPYWNGSKYPIGTITPQDLESLNTAMQNPKLTSEKSKGLVSGFPHFLEYTVDGTTRSYCFTSEKFPDAYEELHQTFNTAIKNMQR